MNLIRTVNGTIRLMSDNELDSIDIDVCVMNAYGFLNSIQKEDLYYEYKTPITDNQVNQIKGMI